MTTTGSPQDQSLELVVSGVGSWACRAALLPLGTPTPASAYQVPEPRRVHAETWARPKMHMGFQTYSKKKIVEGSLVIFLKLVTHYSHNNWIIGVEMIITG